jgi:hypothetical protein
LEGKAFTHGTNQWTLSSTPFGALGSTYDLRTAGRNDIDIYVSGSDVLETATFPVTVVITPGETGVAAKTVLNQATADVWSVNAMQARIPYLVIDTSSTGVYSSFLEITNRGDLDAKVSLDAIISNSDSTVNVKESVTDVITVKKNSVTIIRQTDLDTWFAGITNTQLYRVALLLTVVAPQNTVDISAYHVSPNSRTSADVLYNLNPVVPFLGRQWR